ncbi:MAG: metalloregulator ArsR/SmtB family transcription factor [Anaerolineales bacterium]
MIEHERMAEILKALAHPVRIQIMEVLQTEGEACVCHLEAVLGQRQAYVSQQLAVLRSAGLVVDRRDGLNVFYAPGLKEIEALLAQAQSLARSMALTDGEAWELERIWTSKPEDCACPRCAPSEADAEPQAATVRGG